MNIEILYEDKEVVAINKPSGLVVHSDGKTSGETLVDWIISKYPEIKEVGELGRDSEGKTIYRPGIVHRLDRETSGVMLIAKTQESFENLKKQFQNHEVKKVYHAFVYGQVKEKKGTIDRPIGRSAKDFRLWSAQRGSRGERRDAVTGYGVEISKKDYTFLRAIPKTGRTHQIRVHFKAIHHPLVADSLYAPGKENILGLTRLGLHSYEVNFTDISGKLHTVIAPYPEDFDRAKSLLQSL